MTTLAEIEAAADTLPSEEKEALLRFLAMRLRKAASLSPPERGKGRASEWLRTAKGSVHTAPGESADDARMNYYAAKYGLTK